MNTNIEVLRELDELVEAARLLGGTQTKKLFGCYTDEDSRFARAMYESIDKHRTALLDWAAKQPAAPDVEALEALAGAHECFCDRRYKDANKLESCGDCQRDYIAGAWEARRAYIEEHSKLTALYSAWRAFYAEKVSSWMSLEELRAECGKLQTVDNPSPEVLLVHAMHALEEREQRDEEALDALTHEIWAAAQLAPGEGIVDGVARIAALLRKGPHPSITHCDNCGCDWLDNGLNPIGCPYCKQTASVDEVKEPDLWRCTVCGRIGTVGRCCGEETREPVNHAVLSEGNSND